MTVNWGNFLKYCSSKLTYYWVPIFFGFISKFLIKVFLIYIVDLFRLSFSHFLSNSPLVISISFISTIFGVYSLTFGRRVCPCYLYKVFWRYFQSVDVFQRFFGNVTYECYLPRISMIQYEFIFTINLSVQCRPKVSIFHVSDVQVVSTFSIPTVFSFTFP